MQPQNPLSNLLPELLFSCMTGNPNISDRSALKVFLCSGVKVTSKDLYQKVDGCWQSCLAALMKEWNISPKLSLQFVKKWIKGEPEFNVQTLYELLNIDLSIENPPEPKRIYPIPTLWASSNHDALDVLAYTRGTGRDIAFIDLIKHQFIEELKDDNVAYPIFTNMKKPLFHENGVFILFNTLQGLYEIRFYTFETNGLVLKTTRTLSPEWIESMQILDDYIVFTYSDKIVAVAIGDLINSNSPSFIYSEGLRGAVCLKAFSSQILIWQDERFQMVYIENRQFKFNDCVMDGDNLPDLNYINRSHVFHAQSQCSIFLFQNSKNQYRVGSISPDELTPTEPQIFHMHSKPIQNQSVLVEYKDSVLLCSKEPNFLLQIKKLDINDGKIHIAPLYMEGMQDLQCLTITSATCCLDKLFIIGKFYDQGYSLEIRNKLVIINMATMSVEHQRYLGSDNLLSTSCLSSTLGKMHIMMNQTQNSYILKVDYT